MMRQITSMAKLISPTIGNCASDQITAITSNTQRVSTRLTMKPTTMAEIENRKKNEEPRKPNCSGSSFKSVLIGTPARLTTILSAKLTTMNRNRRKVIFQAPFGVGNALIIGSLASWPVATALRDASHGRLAKATGYFYEARRRYRRAVSGTLPATGFLAADHMAKSRWQITM